MFIHSKRRAILSFAMGLLLAGRAVAVPISVGAGKDYAIIQLGNESTYQLNEGPLDITSNSSIFGSVLKGVEDGDKTKLSTSKVTGSWDIETGVIRDGTASWAGTTKTLTSAEFERIASDAKAASAYWAAYNGGGTLTNFSILDGQSPSDYLIQGSGGTNTFLSATDFKLTSKKSLTLKGGASDLFIFNIPADKIFQISGQAKIVLDGINPGQVLWNVLGSESKKDAHIGGSDVLFAGTLLAPGRNVIVSQTHFHTFKSGGHAQNLPFPSSEKQPPSTTEVTYAEELAIFRAYGFTGTMSDSGAFTTSGAGLFGQIVAGGKVSWTESDISHQPFFMPEPDDDPRKVPDGGTTALSVVFGLALIGVAGFRRRESRSR